MENEGEEEKIRGSVEEGSDLIRDADKIRREKMEHS